MSYRKFNNSSCKCMAGHIHQSRGESAHCSDLFLLKKAGEIKDYQIQKRFDLKVNEKTVCQHYVDFYIEDKYGKFRVEEYKGFATDTWRIKKNLFEALFPEIPYVVIRHKTKRW